MISESFRMQQITLDFHGRLLYFIAILHLIHSKKENPLGESRECRDFLMLGPLGNGIDE